jgi:2-polyprenyl-6-methoxyphenol hydroxylase-like FAD-dependent oxidoreductase
MNSGVARYDPDIPSLTLENGATYSADLIVAADGLCVLTHGTSDSGR